MTEQLLAKIEKSIDILESQKNEHYKEEINEALDMAISALSEELSEDGTLTVHVSDGSKVKRVFVMGDNIYGGLYYPDSVENKGDLISRQAVERLIWEYLRRGTDENIAFYEHFLDLPSVENKREFERMTNGEVIKALFPNGKVIECDEATGYEQMLDDENSYCSWFDSLWWNAPYKEESEGE
jgi:hypothetical protein